MRHVDTVDSEGTGEPHWPIAVDRAERHDGGTRLSLHDGRAVQFNAQPDTEGVWRVRRVLRRVERVDLVVAANGITASVIGVGHRRRSHVPVSLGTALALVLDGTPGTFTLADAHLVTEAAGVRS